MRLLCLPKISDDDLNSGLTGLRVGKDVPCFRMELRAFTRFYAVLMRGCSSAAQMGLVVSPRRINSEEKISFLLFRGSFYRTQKFVFRAGGAISQWVGNKFGVTRTRLE